MRYMVTPACIMYTRLRAPYVYPGCACVCMTNVADTYIFVKRLEDECLQLVERLVDSVSPSAFDQRLLNLKREREPVSQRQSQRRVYV